MKKTRQKSEQITNEIIKGFTNTHNKTQEQVGVKLKTDTFQESNQ